MPHPIKPVFAERYPVALTMGIIDFTLIVLGSYIAFFLRFRNIEMDQWYLLATFSSALTIIIFQIATGCYSSWRGQGIIRPLGRQIAAWISAIGFIFIILVLLKFGHYYSRIWLTSYVIISFFFTVAARLVAFYLLYRARKKGHNLKKVIVLTDSTRNHFIFNQKNDLQKYGYEVENIIELDIKDVNQNVLTKTLEQCIAHEIWICLPLSSSTFVKQIMLSLQNHMADIRYLPDFSDLPLLNYRMNVIANMATIDISCSAMDGPNRALKRAEDILLGSLFTLSLLPVAGVIYILVKLSSPGPAIFKQYRTGINGKRFKVYKFRTMKMHTEKDGLVTQATQDDPRITKIGAFLRRSSLDEIPQFFNVLQGRMSIVGPRPHALEHNEYYKELVESYMRRHKVKPGITGWAQVNGYRGETDTLDKMEKRVEYDLWYINNWSLWLDIKIIWMTIFKGFFTKQP